MLRARLRWQSKSQERLLVFSRSKSFLHSHKDLTCLYYSGCLQHRYYITKAGQWRKDVLEGHVPFCFNFFLQKIFARLKSLFLPLFAFVTAREKCFFLRRWVAWLILTFRDRTYLVFCFLGCVVEFQASEANSWWRSPSSNPGSRVCVLFFFFFLFLPTFSIFYPFPLPLLS